MDTNRFAHADSGLPFRLSSGLRRGVLYLLAVFGLAALPGPVGAVGQPSAAKPDQAYGQLPMSFEVNEGQSDGRVRFLARGAGYELFLTGQTDPTGLAAVLALRGRSGAQGDVVRMDLEGAAGSVPVSGESMLPGKVNYFLGDDPAKWHADVPTYGGVRYAGVYPGVDLVFLGSSGEKARNAKLEYDFVLAPGADARQLRLRVRGARLRLDANGGLTAQARHGSLAWDMPVIYQVKDGKRVAVEGGFRLLAGNRVGFALGKYDHARELVIDPVLVYSTYLGGSGNFYASTESLVGDGANAVAVDGLGNAYLTGYTYSFDFPVTPRAVRTSMPSQATVAFVSKMNAAGTALLYSTYLGGTGYRGGYGSSGFVLGDAGNGIAVDAQGNAYVVGDAHSKNFPTTVGAFQRENKGTPGRTNNGGANAPYADSGFVTKLNATGSKLVYSTYLGGDIPVVCNCWNDQYGDYATAVAVDGNGIAYVTGVARSLDFPVSAAAIQTVNKAAASGGSNAFVTAMNAAGTGLVYSTYLGGYGASSNGFPTDSAAGIAVDASGNAYVTGQAVSTDFPVTSGSFQTVNHAAAVGGSNAFLSKVNATGTGLVYSTYLGGSLGDGAGGLAVDASGSAYVMGGSGSADFPITPGALQTANSGGFVTKFDAAGSALVYSTFVGLPGGGPPDWPGGVSLSGIAVDGAGEAYVTGSTYATNFPVTPDALQSVNQGAANQVQNVLLAKLNATGTALEYATYLGGSGSFSSGGEEGDFAGAIAVDGSGTAYLAGTAYSYDFPVTAKAFQLQNNTGTYDSSSNAFVARFAIGAELTATTVVLHASLSLAKIGEKVMYSAEVVPGPGSGVPAGSMAFSIDGGSPVLVPLDGTGSANYLTGIQTAGQHVVSATYAGDTHFLGSSGSVTEAVFGAAAGLKIVSGSGQTGTYGSPYGTPLVVMVMDSNGLPVEGAVVSFSGRGLHFSRTTEATNAGGTVIVTATATLAGGTVAEAAVGGVEPAMILLTAKQAPLTVRANNVTVPYGEAIPSLTYGFAGFVNGDTAKVIAGAPTETTTAVQGSPVGSYPIVVGTGTLAAANYSFVPVNGTVTIVAAGAQ